MGIGGFLSKIGGAISRGISKLPSVFGRASQFASQKVVPAIRKVGEVADIVSRGVGEEAPEGLRKLGSIASGVSQQAKQIGAGLEKGAKVGGEIAKQLGYQPQVETAGTEEMGGAYMGMNYMR